MIETYSIEVRGSGRVELPAYGLGDAEHRVEKEIAALWPGARAEILDVSRAGAAGRIVEEFLVRYRVRGTETLAAAGKEEARTGALRLVRARFAGSRFERITLETPPG